ncbi:pectate lyase [Brevundimonas sp.]|uniref:pectate lyase n=1 Tax=Brevundimonas sp. TaxID=1871086 RepID=UPI00289DE94D|nr:pectate lyase [Brevundimonas sp.]
MIARPWFVAAAILALTCTAAPPALAADAPVAWNAAALTRPADWYASPAARRLADNVLTHQSREGGWPKNTPLNLPARPDADPGLANTFDNQATTLPLAFLARMITATGEPAYVVAFQRGLNYVLAAQYPNGGWPQYFPLRGGYHDHVTFNDDAMVRVLNLLQDVAAGREPYAFVDLAQRAQAAEAVARGVDAIVRSQVRQDGRLTAWCAQHDAVTLAPAWARKFEPPSLSGSESVGIVRFLMSIDAPSAEVVAAIEGARVWFERSAIRDTRLETYTNAEGQPDRRLAPAPGADPLWARFYDLQTNAPIFMGRDSVAHADLASIERERRMGYTYVGAWPAMLLKEQYPAWRIQTGR